MNKLSSVSSLLQTSIMMSMNSENGNSNVFMLASDLDVTEKMDPKEEEVSSQRTSTKMMFSSSLSSSLFLQMVEDCDPKNNAAAISSIKSAAIAAALESCVDLPEQDFDAELMQMTASFQKQMSVSSAASDDELIGGTGASKDSFQLFDLDSFDFKRQHRRSKRQEEEEEETSEKPEALLRTNSNTTDTSFDSESTPRACNNNKDNSNSNNSRSEEDLEAAGESSTKNAPFVFPDSDCSSRASAADQQQQEDNDEEDEEIAIVAVRAPPPSPRPTSAAETSWVTPASSERVPLEIVNLKERMDQEFAIHENEPIFFEDVDDNFAHGVHQEYYNSNNECSAMMMPPPPAMTVTTASGSSRDLHDSWSTSGEYYQQHRPSLTQYRQSSFSGVSVEHCPPEYYEATNSMHSPVGGLHLHHHPNGMPEGPNMMMPMNMPQHIPTSPTALPPSNEIQDVYLAAAERLRHSMQRSKMSRTAVVQPTAATTPTAPFHQTANSGALLRERHPMFHHHHHPAMITPTNSSDSASAFYGNASPQMHYTDGTPVNFMQQQRQFFY